MYLSGIDTIKLKTNDLKMSADLLRQNEFRYNYTDVLKNGVEISSHSFSKFFENENKERKLFVSVNENELKIECSIPKFMERQNIELANNDDLQKFNNELYILLNKNGIDTDTEKLNISRIDITKNNQMKYQSIEYMKLLHNLRCRYMKKNNEKDFDTSMTWGNTNKQYCIYDKMNETENKISNILRCEKRFFRNSLIESKLKSKTLTDLINNYDNVLLKADESIKQDIFNLKDNKQLNDDLTSGLTNIIQNIFESKKNKRKKLSNTINELIMIYGIQRLRENYTIDTIIKIIDEIELMKYDNDKRKTYKYRLKKQLSKWYDLELITYNKLTDKINYKQMYDEIVEKLM